MPAFNSYAAPTTPLTGSEQTVFAQQQGSSIVTVTTTVEQIMQAGSTAPAVAVTPGASPFAYTATAGGVVYVSGGTVSAISLTRKATEVATGATAGAFPVRAGDILTVTYSAAPTINLVPG